MNQSMPLQKIIKWQRGQQEEETAVPQKEAYEKWQFCYL